ncbi:MAG: AAA family ATPase [Chloroflexi bacterium]|nr:AAA family ATPase [Chloroflexota bacterium]
MSTSVSSPSFVGRRDEMERITTAEASARVGRGALVLVAGEAGVGKTRLVDEAVRRTRDAGGLVLVGACVDLAGAGVPFAPIRDALRGLLAGLPPEGLEALIGQSRAELIYALLDLGSATLPERVGLGSDSSGPRFAEACLDLFGRLAVERPLLVVVEDIHWADRSTLDLLSYLARSRLEVRFVVLATFRSDELHRRHALQPFLAEMARTRTTERLDLRRFDRAELEEQLQGILGGPVETGVIDRVQARSDGNPFYAEEVLLVDTTGEELPAALRDVLLTRVATVSQPTQELLRIASVAGTQVPVPILVGVTRREEADLEPMLREAIERHLLVPREIAGEASIAFRHALVQEAVYAELLPGERVRLHAAYAEAMGTADRSAKRSGHGHAAQIARHWLAAHDLPRALVASMVAATTAIGMHAFTEALAEYERVLELWDQVPNPEQQTGFDRIAVLESAARAASESVPPRAAILIAEAIRLAGEASDPTRLGLLKERLGRYAWTAGDELTAIDACREAVRLVPREPPTAARARVLASLGQILMITAQFDEARVVCEEAVAVARATGAAEIECHALDSLGVTSVYLGDLAGGLAELREAGEIAQRIGSIDETARVQANRIDVLANSGRLAEAVEATIEAVAFTEEHGLTRVVGVLDLAEGALALFRLGRWPEARQMLSRAGQYDLAGTPQIFRDQRLMLLDVAEGRHDVAVARLPKARQLIARVVEAQLIAPLAEAAAELDLWQGRPADARREIGAALGHLAPGSSISRLGPLFALGLRAEAELAATARARKREATVAEGRAVADRLLAEITQMRWMARDRLPNFEGQADAWWSICVAEYARVGGGSDPKLWDAAADAFDAISMPYPRAYARMRAAEAILATSRSRSAAASRLQEAHEVATQLGAEPLRGEIAGVATRARIDLVDSAAEVPAGMGRGDAVRDAILLDGDPIGLTSREREVLTLVAAGRTNREIAERLFITEGTAGTHVSNILGKLGVRGRTEAAAVAHRLALLPEYHDP